MTRPEYRALLSGVGLLAAASLLLELLSFRLVAATMGREYALVVGVSMPAAAAVGAMAVARRSPLSGSAALMRGAAHLAALAGTFAVLGTIGLTWVSQKVATARGEGDWLHVGVMLASCLVPAALSGAALGVVMRRAIHRIGRFTFAEAAGAALGCLAIPLVMLSGAPRGAIANGLLYAVAALAFAWVGRAAKPRTAVIATLPLAIVSLVAGDVGSPWLKMRVDHAGRRSDVEHTSWSAQGVIAVRKAKRGITRLTVDQHTSAAFAGVRSGNAKPRFAAQDLGYEVSRGEAGPVLVVGATGGREISVALANDHPRVDAISLHPTLVNDFLLDRYATITGHVIHDEERVHVRIGDGRATLSQLPRDYQHVVVMNTGRFDQAAPRLLSHDDRLYTADAVADYLERLRDDGTLLLRIPREGIAGAMTAVQTALLRLGLVGSPDEARARMIVCSGRQNAVLLLSRQTPTGSELHNLKKRCKKSRLHIDYPLDESGRARPADEARGRVLLAALERSHVPTDDMPFVIAPTGDTALRPAAVAALRALLPQQKSDPDEETESSGAEELPAPAMTPAGIAAGALLVSLGLVLLGLLTPPPRTREGERGEPARLPPTLRWSFPWLGVALALCMFSLGDQLMRVLGDAGYGWALVIPLGLVGVASGRLWVDTIARDRLRGALTAMLGAALLWLVVMSFLFGPIAGLDDASTAVQLTVSMVVLVISGWLLGGPLALGLRLVGAWDPAPVAWCWGAHLGGWALGGGLAALLVYYVGIAKLWPLGLVAFASGAVLLSLGARAGTPARWFVRRVR